jgi:hypothetical protein
VVTDRGARDQTHGDPTGSGTAIPGGGDDFEGRNELDDLAAGAGGTAASDSQDREPMGDETMGEDLSAIAASSAREATERNTPGEYVEPNSPEAMLRDARE